MAEKLIIELPESELTRLASVASSRGYDNPSDYLLALFAADLDAEPTKEQLLEELQEGLKDAIEGRTYPIDELWQSLDDE